MYQCLNDRWGNKMGGSTYLLPHDTFVNIRCPVSFCIACFKVVIYNVQYTYLKTIIWFENNNDYIIGIIYEYWPETTEYIAWTNAL